MFDMDLPNLLILLVLCFTTDGVAACGNLTYLEPAIQGRTVTFVFKPENYRNGIRPTLKYNRNGQLVDTNTSVWSDSIKRVYYTVLNTSADSTNYESKDFSVSYGNNCLSNWVRLHMKVPPGSPSLHSNTNTSECEDCLLVRDGQSLGRNSYCHSTGGTKPIMYVGGQEVPVHLLSTDMYRPTYIARKIDHMKVIECSVFHAATETTLSTHSKLYVAVKPDDAVLHVPTLKEGEPSDITCTAKGGRPPSTLSLMLNRTNVSAISSTKVLLDEDSGEYTTTIILKAVAKREWQALELFCYQRTPLFSNHVTESKIINCKYPPSTTLLEAPAIPSELQDVYNLTFSCQIQDYNDNCSLQWTSNEPSILEGRHPNDTTAGRSKISTVTVSVTKEDNDKVLVCIAVCSSFQGVISQSYTVLVPFKHEQRELKETDIASTLPWISAAIGGLVLIATIVGSVVVIGKRRKQKELLNRQNEQNNVQNEHTAFNSNVETSEHELEGPRVRDNADEAVEYENSSSEIHNYSEMDEIEIHTYEAFQQRDATEHLYGH